MTSQEFINLISPCAVADMKESGILASVTIAQAILESGYGTTELAINANNYFGMKCFLSGNTWYSVWDGVSKYTKQTKEQKKDGTEYTITADFRKYPDLLTNVKDHSLYLLGAMDDDGKRYEGLAGETDYKKAIQIIKDGGYATDVDYVAKVCDIIERYNLTQYDVKEEFKMGIKIVEKIATQNPCYKAGRKIDVKGEMLHSVGCPQPDPLVFVKIWQKSDANVCVHAVVGKDPTVYLLLPYDHRAWHCGGDGNNYLFSLEMTEPATIKYTGGASWVETGNGANTKAHVLATYANAVELFAYVAKKYGLNPENGNVVMSHAEGHKKGIASNHGDVEHIWKKFGLTMNQFRKDVKKAMAGQAVTTVPSTPVDNTSDDTANQSIKAMNGTVTVIYDGADGLNVRTKPSILDKYVDHVVGEGEVFTVVGISADEKWYKLKSGLFISTIPDYVKFKATEEQKASTAGTGYYRVRKSWDKANTQIGAFKIKENAIEICKQNSGYKVFDNDGKEIYPCIKEEEKEFKFRVTIPDLRIRKGAGTTYDYHKKNGKAIYTGVGTFTIVKTKEGAGAKLWGLLKSYADNENGWIALDEDYGYRA